MPRYGAVGAAVAFLLSYVDAGRRGVRASRSALYPIAVRDWTGSLRVVVAGVVAALAARLARAGDAARWPACSRAA